MMARDQQRVHGQGPLRQGCASARGYTDADRADRESTEELMLLPTSLIIGSGPAAAGAALALTQHRGQPVTVVDIGTQLEADQRRVVDAMAGA